MAKQIASILKRFRDWHHIWVTCAKDGTLRKDIFRDRDICELSLTYCQSGKCKRLKEQDERP